MKDRIEYAAILSVAKFLQCMSVETAASFCAFFWRLIAPHTRRQRRIIEHLRLAFPHLTDTEINKLSRKIWDNLGRVMGETIHLRDLRSQAYQSDRDFERVPLFHNVDAERGGIVLVSGHIGPYELVIMASNFVGYRPSGIYQELNNPMVDRFLADLRAPMYPGGLFPKSHKTARKVLGIVKSGGAVAILADQREFKGIEVSFFGKPAFSNPFPALLARHCNVPFVGGRVIRRLEGRLTYTADEIDMPHTKDRARDILVGTQNFHDLLESYIREIPEQWMWTHRKWAPLPDDLKAKTGNEPKAKDIAGSDALPLSGAGVAT